MTYCYYDAPIGRLMLAEKEGALTGLWMLGQKYFAQTLAADAVENSGEAVLEQAFDWLDRYFAGERPDPEELPLAPEGSAFRQKVWNILREIPYGTVITYGEIARKIAAAEGKKRMASQAVGGAVGHNPISIIIPCHRVIGADGSLIGYGGGIETKRWLLHLEGVPVD